MVRLLTLLVVLCVGASAQAQKYSPHQGAKDVKDFFGKSYAVVVGVNK